MTTIVALKCVDGVVLASDRRATKGGMIGSKGAKKIYPIDEKKAVAIAGQLSDANYLINLIKAEAKLISFDRGFPLTVKEVAKMLSNLQYSGMRSYAPYITEMLVAGIDETGSQVFEADVSGAVTEEDYASSGSGSPMAYGVLEATYHAGISTKEGAEIAAKAVKSAMERDPGSGNGIQVLTITKDGSRLTDIGGVQQ